MKPFQKLTRRGRIQRYRQLARAALAAYGLQDANLTFIRDSGNVTFRVVPTGPAPFVTELDGAHRRRFFRGSFFRDHCVLRLHEPDYQTAEAIASELEWLAALGRDTDLAVSLPVRTLEGALSVEVEVPGVPQPRRCSLLRWVTGRMLSRSLRPHHLQALGRLMAGLHQHAVHWPLPAGFARPRYDWAGLYGDNDFVKAPAAEVWAYLAQRYREPFERVTGRLRQVMDDLGQDRDAFGLIHADIGIGANVLFGGGEARAIDFDDCAFGYWLFDIGVALSELRGDEAFPHYRDALRQGYAEIRALPEEQWAHVDLFIAAWHAFEMYWAAAGAVCFPNSRPGYDRWIERAAGDMVRCLGLKPQIGS